MPAHNPAEIHALFLGAFNRGDVEAVVALYEPNAVIVIGGETVAGRQAIRETYQRLFASHGHMELETRALVETEELALLHANWTYQTEETTLRRLSTEVVRRQADGTWLFVIDEPRTPQ